VNVMLLCYVIETFGYTVGVGLGTAGLPSLVCLARRTSYSISRGKTTCLWIAGFIFIYLFVSGTEAARPIYRTVKHNKSCTHALIVTFLPIEQRRFKV